MKEKSRFVTLPEFGEGPSERGICQVDRRGFLKGSVAAAFGGMLSQWSCLEAAEQLPRMPGARADQCILLWMSGGPSQMETWDPKPDHLNGGANGAIPTSVDGIQISANLPKLAREMKHISLIRSMATGVTDHRGGTYLLHTGYAPSGTVKHPSIGARISSETTVPANFDLPSFISIQTPSVGAGFLGVDHDPLVVRDPNNPIANMHYSIPKDRFVERYKLLERIDRHFAGTRGKQTVADHQKIYRQTVRLMHSKRVERAFNLQTEPEQLVNDYSQITLSGRDQVNQFGLSCLMARKLLEAGVRFVEVALDGWDQHSNIKSESTETGAKLDQGMATLIQDLRSKGMLERTLIVWMGEFGRTPKVNNNAGRDHYGKVWSAAMAGGGVNGGMLVGQTSQDGMAVTKEPKVAADIIATIFKSMGIDYTKVSYSSRGRPIPLVRGGKPIEELVV